MDKYSKEEIKEILDKLLIEVVTKIQNIRDSL